MKPEQSEGVNVVSNLTHKAIARMSGYYTYEREGNFYWRNWSGWIPEVCTGAFNTEEAAYRNCCDACELVEKDLGGQGGPR